MIPVHRRMLDGALYRQLRADRRARGIARRVQATIQKHFDLLLDHLPDNPHSLASLQRLRAIVSACRTAVIRQASAEWLDVASWSHHAAARALTSRTRDLLPRRERQDEPAPFDPFERGAVLFGPGGTFVRTPDPRDNGRFDYSKLTIEPPTLFDLQRIVGPAPVRLSKLFDADKTVQVVWQGISQGHDRRTIAKSLEKVFNNDANAARRVARTEGLRVATQTQLAASEQIPDLVVGYQILATLDSRTRPEHRARHGTIYYREPKAGQKGFDQMPHPPIEADGTIAYNCRCMLAPVFADEPSPNVSYLLGTPYAGDATRNSGVLAV